MRAYIALEGKLESSYPSLYRFLGPHATIKGAVIFRLRRKTREREETFNHYCGFGVEEKRRIHVATGNAILRSSLNQSPRSGGLTC